MLSAPPSAPATTPTVSAHTRTTAARRYGADGSGLDVRGQPVIRGDVTRVDYVLSRRLEAFRIFNAVKLLVKEIVSRTKFKVGLGALQRWLWGWKTRKSVVTFVAEPSSRKVVSGAPVLITAKDTKSSTHRHRMVLEYTPVRRSLAAGAYARVARQDGVEHEA